MKKTDTLVAPIFIAVVSLLAIGALIEGVVSLFNRSRVEVGEKYEESTQVVATQAL